MYINPVTMSKSKWDQYLALTESKLRGAQPVTVLVCSLFPLFQIFTSLIHVSMLYSWCHFRVIHLFRNFVLSSLFSAQCASCPTA